MTRPPRGPTRAWEAGLAGRTFGRGSGARQPPGTGEGGALTRACVVIRRPLCTSQPDTQAPTSRPATTPHSHQWAWWSGPTGG